MHHIQVGKEAPKFKLEALVGDKFEKISIDDYKGKWLVLFFYPMDFTFVCPTEILEFSGRTEEFNKLGAEVLACSIDSVYSHLAWTKELGKLNYPLMSDITKDVSRDYGILIEDEGVALRGLYIIDPEGLLKYMVVHDNSIGRSVDETLRVLQALQTGELCQAGWKPGAKSLGKA